jgi:hypothetical protein
LSRPRWEVADVLRLAYPSTKAAIHLPNAVKKALYDLVRCRTEALGGHVLKCQKCSHQQISYNSCRNRHCPKCQFSKREQWILDRESEVLPVRYFHVVFTVPHQLNPIMKQYPKIMYGLLFKTAWKTIRTLAYDPKWLGAQTGMISVLHTWGQNLSFHPHLHCIIPGGGFLSSINRWISLRHRAFLFPVKVMSALFRRFFLEALTSLFHSSQLIWKQEHWLSLLPQLKASSFNVFAKTPFAGPKQVIHYLGRYSHRVAITNARINKVTDKIVTFQYRDYRTQKNGHLSLSLMEFARRFLQHVLPKGFSKIRHFGFLSNRSKKKQLAAILLYLGRKKKPKKVFDAIQYFSMQLNIDLTLCPICKKGKLQNIAVIPACRGQPKAALSSQIFKACRLSKQSF